MLRLVHAASQRDMPCCSIRCSTVRMIEAFSWIVNLLCLLLFVIWVFWVFWGSSYSSSSFSLLEVLMHDEVFSHNDKQNEAINQIRGKQGVICSSRGTTVVIDYSYFQESCTSKKYFAVIKRFWKWFMYIPRPLVMGPIYRSTGVVPGSSLIPIKNILTLIVIDSHRPSCLG